jgi:hypothetical protein
VGARKLLVGDLDALLANMEPLQRDVFSLEPLCNGNQIRATRELYREYGEMATDGKMMRAKLRSIYSHNERSSPK